MNKVVLHHFPSSRLPEELRGQFPPDAAVTLAVEEEQSQPDSKVMSAERLKALFALVRPTFKSSQEVEDYVRAMRDEWD